MIELSVIILNFNTEDYLHNLLRSIEEQNLDFLQGQLEVIVVDNSSTDGSVKMVQREFSWVKIIKNKRNLGFAKANNQAIKIAKGEIILLLNSDTLVKDDSLEKIVELLNKNQNAGAATARLELTDKSLDLACHRGFPTPWNAFTYFFGLERLFPNFKIFSGYHQTWKDFNIQHEVDAISGACFFIKRKAIEEVGLLDERFFMYAEDLDWCLRLRKAGWKIFYYPQAKIIHFKKRSGREKDQGKNISEKARDLRSQAIGHFYETMKLFYDKHYKKKYPAWVRHTVLVGIWLFTRIKLFSNRYI